MSFEQVWNDPLDYDRPVEIKEGVYWVGFSDPERRLHCNPYLIIDGGEAVLIDGGSRPEFSTVMMKIMQTGLDPYQITKLIYQHYDPDLCGSIPNLESLIGRPDLELISHTYNNDFIRYYSVRSPMRCIDKIGRTLTFGDERVLRFIPTPYAHAPGSFMTYDEKSGILFTSDIFGSQEPPETWQLFADLNQTCLQCAREIPDEVCWRCEETDQCCPLASMFSFHRTIMTSNRALRLAIDRILEVDPQCIAPQHGSIYRDQDHIRYICQRLKSLDDIGIDRIWKQLDGSDFT